MSGNIFASSTVPGIKDRDGDKQTTALWSQSYYLSRSDYTTAYWVKLMIGSTLLMLVVPIFLAQLFLTAIAQPQVNSTVLLSHIYPLALRPAVRDPDVSRVVEVPISAVLKGALSRSETVRARGLLVGALLEVQNPELTSFAGVGYGVYLKDVNKGARMETFPGGRVPRCGVGGRYDEWGRVRGLRYAYQWISTVEEKSLMGKRMSRSGGGEEEGSDGVDVESLLMGWSALLLERAGVSDSLNPLPPGSSRNVYGEAVDRVVRGVCKEGGCDLGRADYTVVDKVNSTVNGDGMKEGGAAQEKLAVQGRSESTDDRFMMSRAESTFILPTFLALYAVAMQDTKWLVIAVEQIRASIDDPGLGTDQKTPTIWSSATLESSVLGSTPEIQDEHNLRLESNPWTLGGVVRVLSVLEKWKPNLEQSTLEETIRYGNWKDRAVIELKEMLNTLLAEVKDEGTEVGEVLRFCAESVNAGGCESSFGDVGGTALFVSSIYRLAQLNMLDDLGLLEWADELYNTVARHVGEDGQVSVPSDGTQGERSELYRHAGEDESMVILMWAARRDCEKLGVCQTRRRERWWHRMGWHS